MAEEAGEVLSPNPNSLVIEGLLTLALFEFPVPVLVVAIGHHAATIAG